MCTICMYVSKSCVDKYLEALVFKLVMRLTFTKFAWEQFCEQLYCSCAFVSKLYRVTHEQLTSLLQSQVKLISTVHMSVKLKLSCTIVI